jgi:hypothetical protein
LAHQGPLLILSTRARAQSAVRFTLNDNTFLGQRQEPNRRGRTARVLTSPDLVGRLCALPTPLPRATYPCAMENKPEIQHFRD